MEVSEVRTILLESIFKLHAHIMSVTIVELVLARLVGIASATVGLDNNDRPSPMRQKRMQ